MDRTKDLGGVRGKYSKWATEQIEREIQFGIRSLKLGFQINPELLATYQEMQVELSIRTWVTGRANGEIKSGTDII